MQMWKELFHAEKEEVTIYLKSDGCKQVSMKICEVDYLYGK